jgi:hypothetical protein
VVVLAALKQPVKVMAALVVTVKLMLAVEAVDKVVPPEMMVAQALHLLLLELLFVLLAAVAAVVFLEAEAAVLVAAVLVDYPQLMGQQI